jgi:ABC-type Mn2+/Zn2+ transport system ATPase subunit
MATFDDVQFRYGDLVALDRTTTEFERGTSIALVGANGSGKSTVLKLLAGLLTATSGTVRRANDAVAFVAQQHHHHQWLPIQVAEVLRMGCYRRRGLLGRITADDRREIDHVADRLGIRDLMARSYGELSGGQRQRVLVAQALIGPPDLVLLDEPITGLDLPSQEVILGLVDDETRRGATVVFSTHHLEEAKRADRVMLLAGCVVADGPPGDVLRPQHLTMAFGGRVLDIGGGAVIVDDHGHHDHDHTERPDVRGHAPADDAAHHDDLGHRHLHEAEHTLHHDGHHDPAARPPTREDEA